MRFPPLTALLFYLASPAAALVRDPPREDLDARAEHVLESEMNNRLLTLPLFSALPDADRAGRDLQVSYGEVRSGPLTLRAPGVAFGYGIPLLEASELRLLGFFDRLLISGPGGNELLHPLFDGSIPLDLPEYADLSDPRGRGFHLGLGAAWTWESRPAAPERSWLISGGALWSLLKTRGYRVDYRLTGGADAGKSGVMDYSASYDFLTPFLATALRRPLGASWEAMPHAILAVPLPKRGWKGRITGPGFDIAGDGASAQGSKPMGDPFAGIGLVLAHRPSGLQLDLGAFLYQLAFEKRIHYGIDRALAISLTWSI